MILVLLGTQDKPFERILKQIVKLKEKGVINDKIVAQVGCTKFNSDKIEMFNFISNEELIAYIEKARLIISHGGVGFITECVTRGKKVIVVPRLKKYKEHTNDHQVQITKEFASKGYVIPLYDVKNLSNALQTTKTFKPNKYESNTEHFKNSIRKYIEEL